MKNVETLSYFLTNIYENRFFSFLSSSNPLNIQHKWVSKIVIALANLEKGPVVEVILWNSNKKSIKDFRKVIIKVSLKSMCAKLKSGFRPQSYTSGLTRNDRTGVKFFQVDLERLTRALFSQSSHSLICCPPKAVAW